MKSSPAFQFYPSDWLSSQRVQMMTLEEEGAYIRLLCYCWNHGSIPSDPDQIERLLGKRVSANVVTTVQRMFTVRSDDETTMTHPRLEDERLRQNSRKAQTSEAGKKSAENRKKQRIGQQTPSEEGNDDSTIVENPLPRKSNPSSSSSSSIEEEQEKENAPVPPAVGEAPISLDAVKKICGQFSATAEMAEQWWLANDARGWVLDDGRPLARWQSSLTKWANSWRSRDSRAALAAVPGQRPAGSTRSPAPARKAVQTFDPAPDAFETEDPFAAARRNRERLQRERDGEPPPGWDDATAQPQSATA